MWLMRDDRHKKGILRYVVIQAPPSRDRQGVADYLPEPNRSLQ
jgi:hypothetical protein